MMNRFQSFSLLLLLALLSLHNLASASTANDSAVLRKLGVGHGGGAELGISSVGKGKGKGGKSGKSSKASKSKKSSKSGKGKGNVFDSEDECVCERRQRRLGVGHQPPEPCECPGGKGKGSNKSSKSSSSGKGGKGEGGGSPSDSKDDNQHPLPSPPNAEPTRPSENPPSESPPSVPNTPPTRPRPSPTPAPVRPPSELPPSEREPTNGGGGSPTPETPTNDGDNPQPPSPGMSRCQVAGNGLFGSDVGIAQEFAFTYQTLVIPSVTVAELNIDMLAKLEEDMGNEILMRTDAQCSDDPAITESLSKSMSLQYNGGDVQPSQQQQDSRSSTNNDNLATARYNTGAYSNSRHNGQRYLQSSDVSGFSTRPRDVVDEGVECTNVEPVFPCYVISGRVTVFSSTKLDEATQELVRNAIQDSIENGNLADSDNRFLDVTWDMHEDSPDSPEGPSGPPNGGGPSGPPSDGNNPGGDGDPNGGNEEIDRADTTGDGLQPWAWALIGVGGLLFLVMIWFCIRHPKRAVGVSDDDEEDDDKSSSKKSSSHQSQSESVEEQDVYVDEYDEARATPLIANTSSPEPIEEESEGDLSYENLKGPDSGGVDSAHSQRSGGSESQRSDDQSQSSEYDLSDMPREMDDRKDPNATQEETSDSAHSSYEEEVEEEYEVEYLQDSQRSGAWSSGNDVYSYEGTDNDGGSSNPSTQESLPMMAHSAQQGNTSSFDSMRRKWEAS